MKMKLEQEEIETTNIIPHCNCGVPTKIRTFWTKANPGRKFFGCPNFADHPRVVILGLLKSKGALEKARKKE
ncbi:hypothetical protein GQ457_02G022080 [Hibiscus cannabinus]